MPDHRLGLLHALKTELGRSQSRLRLPGEDGPYFIRYLVREYDDYDLVARFGALMVEYLSRLPTCPSSFPTLFAKPN